MKGVDIVVGGSIGHMSAFMAQAGRLVVRGDAGEALGDSIYDETFNHGGEIMAKKLSDLGATQVGEHGRHDAASAVKPTTQAEEWAGALTSVIDSVTA